MAETCPINNLAQIMLSTDGSEFSEGAVKEAILLAKNCSSRLTAIEVVEANEEYASEAPDLVAKAETDAAATLDQVKDQAEDSGIGCITEVHTGDSPFRIIVDEAKKKDIELIVMGRRGRTGLKRVAMGSVTARVVGHAPCDVLVVPRECSLEFKSIMVATDGSDQGKAAAREAIKMAKKVGGDITAMSVATSDSKIDQATSNVNDVKEMAAQEGLSCETVIATGRNYVQIVEKAIELGTDLIVIGCHGGGGGFSTLLMGSTTERVIGHSKCAVLVACS